ncbi:MAG: ARMT1-like domain-containing protein [Anaerolineae bacterium]|nr:ARMT1-like domain-containing protein [Anaerolineae bacterium]
MKATPACIPCYLRQALAAAREVTEDAERQRHVLTEVAKILPELPLESTPAHNSTRVLWRAQEVLGCDDPWAAQKRHYSELALHTYPQLKVLVEGSPDPLGTALRIAAAGNVIDLGILGGGSVDVEGMLNELLSKGFATDDSDLLRRAIRRSRDVLYLIDNAGETLFDRVLIEELISWGLRVTVAAKGQPILNDATVEDARMAGLDQVAEVVSNGSPMIGTALESCSQEFLDLFERAQVIISKGQANFETLNEIGKPIFFILKAKCPEVARELGVSVGEVVAMFSSVSRSGAVQGR